jgi:hypothetical protein
VRELTLVAGLALLAANACVLSSRHPEGPDLSLLDDEAFSVVVDDFKASERCAPVAEHPIRVDSASLTNGILTSDPQVKHETKGRDWPLMSVMLEQLRERNAASQPISWQPPSPLGVVVMDLSTLRSEYDFLESFSDTRCHMRLWLPGYSPDGQHALVRFSWGPTSHGATATYLLDRTDGSWHVRWKHVAVYAWLLPGKRMQLTSHRALRWAW